MRIRKTIETDGWLDDTDIMTAAKISDALAHPLRILIFRHILIQNFANKPVTNKDLVAFTDYAQATVSQHLSKLIIGGLVEARKQGTSSCYYPVEGKLSEFIKLLEKIDSSGREDVAPDFLRPEVFGVAAHGDGDPAAGSAAGGEDEDLADMMDADSKRPIVSA